MKCPHCEKEVLVRLVKDDGKNNPQDRATVADSSDLEKLLNSVHDDELETEFEEGFMKSVRERFAQYGARTLMSEKQMATLRKIAAKVAE